MNMVDMYRNRLPNRSNAHVSESFSYNVFMSIIGSDWIVRELTERDYGIDLIIERVEGNESVTGKLAAIQLKSIQEIKFNQNYEFRYYKIKPTSTDYWMNSNLPVFVFLVNSDGTVYFKNVGDYVRKNYKRYVEGDNFYYSFLPEDMYESTKFIQDFYFESGYEVTEETIVNFDFLYRELSELFGRYRRDAHMTVDDDELVQRISSLHYRLTIMSQRLGIDKVIPSLDDLVKNYRFSGFSDVYEHHFSLMLELLDELSIDIIRVIKAKIVDPYKIYWLYRDLNFTYFIENVRNEKLKDRYWRRLQEGRS
ncbi:TPA: DUF4365 domain-containing protein [Vibrio parahaemolyticus]|uniref:DUF4365 domain-containing protein n=1 Tax=Vibrio parahaemolyticus TaxID=670 RepID=UPI00112059F0|nr:DUF4365 domain-containing protein [Vibrio parahaemolyticus]MBE3893087.1 DUF4365 domain-containing protein [Vibrio parahaemolyticus]TOD73672.1 hypothetical protein CGJ57_24350 [Vibrio parahaemolyticus]TOG38374.1 hypothetical protein CGJ02_25095 [Vibrio parahaemolyticus]HCG9621000.1 DUF4365 domain-containing protein [Vibrio parahaemolyticus]HCM1391534.1 DUF4365 domain-containing protein [Vibrio parahaemolyticus]